MNIYRYTNHPRRYGIRAFLGSSNVISILDDTRKFIDIDINPFSKISADFLINLPTQAEYKKLLFV